MADRPRPDSEEDFARMLGESFAPKSHREGETVEGTIVSIGAEVAFVDIGGKGEATIDVEELVDPDSDVRVKVGDTVQAVVVSTVGGLRLSHRLARGAVTRQRLNDAFRAGLPVEGRVEKAIKGGYEVRVGGQRAFCPISQIDTRFTADPSVHVGQAYTFRIVECKEDGKELVVSRRAFLQEEEGKKAEAIRRVVVPGAVLPGHVMSVMAYGAFVDLGGGVQGLLHVSEMGWSRVGNPMDVVRPGDAITVKVLRVGDEDGKIALGLKQLRADPWSTVAEKYRVGQALKGKVTRVADFGVFVELEPGIDGLVHVSEIALDRGSEIRKAFPLGSDVEVIVLEVDPAGRRIQLSRKAVLEAGEKREAREYAEQQEQAQTESFGSLADKLRAAVKPPKP